MIFRILLLVARVTLIAALPLILTSLRIFSSQVSPQISSNIRYDYSGVAAMISLPVNTWILSLEEDQESQQLRRTLCSVHVVVGTPKKHMSMLSWEPLFYSRCCHYSASPGTGCIARSLYLLFLQRWRFSILSRPPCKWTHSVRSVQAVSQAFIDV